MGTNYYTFSEKKCKHEDIVDGEICWNCFDTGYERIHIGKSSAGWQFSFRAYPDLKLISFDSWIDFLIDKKIYNEYNEEVKLTDLVDTIIHKQNENFKSHTDYCRALKQGDYYNSASTIIHGYEDCFKDKEGYNFITTEFS